MSEFKDKIKEWDITVEDSEFVVVSKTKNNKEILSGINRQRKPIKIKSWTRVYIPSDHDKYTGSSSKEVEEKIKNKDVDLKSIKISKKKDGA